eukprot:GHVQ01019350.1.p3 GENE.GHVQ01019350.1~~GHVQ01019350.1.p3  ORF type:complete len:236 (-),score=40.16 GHVQ01019350.1:3491-4198(-)
MQHQSSSDNHLSSSSLAASFSNADMETTLSESSTLSPSTNSTSLSSSSSLPPYSSSATDSTVSNDSSATTLTINSTSAPPVCSSSSSASSTSVATDTASITSSVSSDLLRKCSGCGHNVRTTLNCPTCTKLGLPPSFFCTADCFKKHWPAHKAYHSIIKRAMKTETEALPASVCTKPRTLGNRGDSVAGDGHHREGGTTTVKSLDPATYNPFDESSWRQDSHLMFVCLLLCCSVC